MSTTGEVVQTQQETTELEIEKHTKAFKSGANWYYWIAGLSMINTVLFLFESDWSFVVGLGITQVFAVFAKMAAEGAGPGGVAVILKAIGFLFALFAAGVFVLCGWQAGKKRHWAFILGMVLYFFDGLIFLFVKDWLSLGFHAFALFSIWAGYSALRKLETLEVKSGVAPIVPGGA